MKYIGLQKQISKNNVNTFVLLATFPIIVLGLVWLFLLGINMFANSNPSNSTSNHPLPFSEILAMTNTFFINIAPIALIVVVVWFIIAYFINTSMISSATSSITLNRKDNPEVYNLVENLCISIGMKTPKINVVEDSSLNAFASGINEKTYAVTLTRGIIDKLSKEELEGVVAHELTHIRNKDVRLLIVSIVFVGVFTFIATTAMRSIMFSGSSSNRKDGKSNIVIIVLAIALAGLGVLLSSLVRFAISRKREYLADAGAASITKNPLALASALRSISSDRIVETVQRKDVAMLFIANPMKSMSVMSMFATHPPIEDRIKVLEQM